MIPSLAFSMPGPFEMVVLLIVALLVFGRRLPDVARSMGRSINEFKRGLNSVGDDIERVEGGNEGAKPLAPKAAEGSVAKTPAGAAAAADPLEKRARGA
jgi:sec-independent protein translocase protein TatA